MNASLLTALSRVVDEWPIGALVWHKADGQRGVLTEYRLQSQGRVMLGVAFGHAKDLCPCLPEELSTTRVSEGAEGDEWKDDEPGGLETQP